MTSAKKIAANQNNAKDSTGPKTELGKQRSKRNATKHSILSRELLISDADKNEFEVLRSELQDQFSPATTLQRIAFDRILCALWKQKLAVRLDAQRLKEVSDQFKNENSDNTDKSESLSEKLLKPDWYGASGADLRATIRFLSHLRGDVEANGWIHAEDWKPQVVRTFGENFFSMFSHWVPINIDAIYASEAITAHKERYGSPLPPVGSGNARILKDPRLSWQMGVKLIDLMNQHLESLARINRLGADGNGKEHPTFALELATRYFTSATRELERAVAWYLFIKEQRL